MVSICEMKDRALRFVFIISFLLSDLDIEKRYETLNLGIENALIRMNQRKDYLLDEIVLESFE